MLAAMKTRCSVIAKRPRCRLHYSAKSGRLELGDNILGHYRSIFNHCNIIGLQSHRIRWKTQNKSYYVV